MKKIKRIAAVCLVFALALAAVPQIGMAGVVETGACGEGVTYALHDDGRLVIGGEGAVDNYEFILSAGGTGETTAPWAARADEITAVEIGPEVTAVGDHAFYFCKNLASAAFGAGVARIGENAFSGCALQTLDLPETLSEIGRGAFSDCAALAAVSLPAGVSDVGAYAFSGCGALEDVTVPAGAFRLGAFVFSGTPWFDAQPEGIVYAGNTACGYKGEFPEPYDLALREGCAGVADEAFFYLTELRSVLFPASVECVGERIFHGCKNLSTITVDEENPVYRSAGNCVIRRDTGTLVIGCGASEIPADGTVAAVGPWAFARCAMESVSLPAGVETVGEGAFYQCEALRDVRLPESLAAIGESAFAGCVSLKTVRLPKDLRSLGERAFSGCGALESVSFPAGACEVARAAFEDTAWLARQPEGPVYAGKILYTYKGALPEGGALTLRADCLGVAGAAFEGRSDLREIALQNRLAYVGAAAFSGCTGLARVTVGAGLRSIGAAAFAGCRALAEVLSKGTPETHAQIAVGERNEAYTNAALCFLDAAALRHAVGDVDGSGSIEPADARLALRVSLGILEDEGVPLSDESVAAADVTGDGEVLPADARLILRKSLGLDVSAEGWQEPEPPSEPPGTTDPANPPDATDPANP